MSCIEQALNKWLRCPLTALRVALRCALTPGILPSALRASRAVQNRSRRFCIRHKLRFPSNAHLAPGHARSLLRRLINHLRMRPAPAGGVAALPALAIVLGISGALQARADSIGIGFASVRAAYTALSARSDAIVDDQTGWTRIALPGSDGLTVWSFAPRGHPAFPALVRRDVLSRDGVPTLVTRFLCEGRRAACETLYADLRGAAGI
jgi:hypothetical protein